MRYLVLPLLLVLTLCGVAPTLADDSGQEPGAAILMYHRFRTTATNFTTVTNEHFESQIIWLKEHGYNFVKLSTIVDAIREGHEPPAKTIAITVDDGHFTQYQNMYPILQKYQVPATLFIYTDAIASKNMPNAISWDQLREMEASGLIEVQSHSLSHPDLVQKRRELSPDEYYNFAMTELTRSKSILEEKLGHKISYFAWPYGALDQSLERMAEKAGYVAAFGVEGKLAYSQSNIFALPRFHVMNDVIGDKISALVTPVERKHTRIASPIEKNAMPPRIKVKPALSALTMASANIKLHDKAKLVSADAPVPPSDIPAGN